MGHGAAESAVNLKEKARLPNFIRRKKNGLLLRRLVLIN